MPGDYVIQRADHIGWHTELAARPTRVNLYRRYRTKGAAVRAARRLVNTEHAMFRVMKVNIAEPARVVWTSSDNADLRRE